MNYTMGKPGCDNKITYHMRELGYTCSKPGKKVINIHFHPTNFRTYNVKDDRVPGPYLLIATVDNFTGEPLHIDGFNEQGQAYRIEKTNGDTVIFDRTVTLLYNTVTVFMTRQ